MSLEETIADLQVKLALQTATTKLLTGIVFGYLAETQPQVHRSVKQIYDQRLLPLAAQALQSHSLSADDLERIVQDFLKDIDGVHLS
jgi:hypothetical protein